MSLPARARNDDPSDCTSPALGGVCAGRRVTTLSEGWTADGVPVTVPHTWNATDGEDGLSAACNADLVARQKGLKSGDYEFDEAAFQRNSARNEGGYVRKAVVYRHALPDPKPDRRYFLRSADIFFLTVLSAIFYAIDKVWDLPKGFMAQLDHPSWVGFSVLDTFSLLMWQSLG